MMFLKFYFAFFDEYKQLFGVNFSQVAIFQIIVILQT